MLLASLACSADPAVAAMSAQFCREVLDVLRTYSDDATTATVSLLSFAAA